MKRMMILLVMALVMFSGSAFAATATSTMTVTASVIGSCSISTTADMAFNIDTFSSVDAGATGTVEVTCGSGITYALSDDGGVGADYTMTDDATGLVPLAYSLAYDTTTQTGDTTAQSFNITGTVAVADFQDPSVVTGTYSDTVTIIVSPTP
ncbi:MAG: spore coat protein U domain-containing protein [Desulfuromonadales bacterium]|nr:spore coat protein U domain-containing protein [Desulfuromonadales bacterium]